MSSVAEVVPATRSIIHLGMDVHKESITIAVLPAGARTPTRVDRLPNDLPKLKRFLDRVARDGEVRACYEASGAGYVLHRAMHEWGYQCDVIAPSLIPKRAGVQRKHDKYDAAELAKLYRAGELVAVRIPTEAEERVRDVVRCRETFQREIGSGVRLRGSMCEHSRGRYAACNINWCRIPEPRMSQLPTNPILAALPKRFGNRRISAGSTVDAASSPRRTMTTAIR